MTRSRVHHTPTKLHYSTGVQYSPQLQPSQATQTHYSPPQQFTQSTQCSPAPLSPLQDQPSDRSLVSNSEQSFESDVRQVIEMTATPRAQSVLPPGTLPTLSFDLFESDTVSTLLEFVTCATGIEHAIVLVDIWNGQPYPMPMAMSIGHLTGHTGHTAFSYDLIPGHSYETGIYP